MSSDPVRFDHPANAKILAYLEDPAHRRSSAAVAVERRSLSPGQVADAYEGLGAHPDLLERLWDQLGARLPLDCRRVVHGAPVLVHPRSGVIFGYCGGSLTYALRLPENERQAAIAAGAQRAREYPAYPALGVEASRLDLDLFGVEWVFGGWFAEEDAWCRAAFDYAGAQAPPSVERSSRQ
jgi:hypothetical protein